jgi:hypothetical protein
LELEVNVFSLVDVKDNVVTVVVIIVHVVVVAANGVVDVFEIKDKLLNFGSQRDIQQNDTRQRNA